MFFNYNLACALRSSGMGLMLSDDELHGVVSDADCFCIVSFLGVNGA
jgi:hypothetical protein